MWLFCKRSDDDGKRVFFEKMFKSDLSDEGFHRLHDELLATGWATLTDGMERRKDGKIACKMRLVHGDDPEWLRLKQTA